MLILVFSRYSLLCMLPEEAKSSYQMADSGYDTYLRDAHRQVDILLPSYFTFIKKEKLRAIISIFAGPLMSLF